MQCPQCQHEGTASARFCEVCGTKLAQNCPACGHEVSPQARFCESCGQAIEQATSQRSVPEPRSYTPKHLAEKILTSRSALEGERKQVTVLFADVKGSMELAEQVDPEEWHRIMDRFFAILSEGVHRFEGTVNQYTGDGIMALFGAPIAHEDHARRACYAALHLRDELRRYSDELRRTRGMNFSVRMGLNSGEVVVGRIGDDLRMDYTAQGYTVGLAARLEQLAEPQGIYLSQHTAQLIEGFFQLRDLGEFELKGARGRVHVYQLQDIGRLRTRLDASRARGFSRFVGRVDEMATLELALHRALEGNGQVVGIVGEAGVGKSRLCLEFVERCRARDIRVLEAHCPAHGKTVPLLPILELLRNSFGITPQDRNQTAREKIAGRLLLLDLASDELLPLVFDFLGVSDPKRPAPQMDPEARQRQLYRFARRLVQARSNQEPAVLLFDDIQWIDSGSDAFLTQLVEATSGTKTMLLVNFRPEYEAEWIGKSYYQQLPLSPLGPEAIDELLSELLGDDPSLIGLRDLIRDRTGGNPFFIEEVVQSLGESGSLEGVRGSYRLARPVEALQISTTVQVVLAARIDRLGQQEKRVLQMASVIGKQFSERLLKGVAELPEAELAAAISVLRDAEFIREEALYPEVEYAFKHPLTQEVAYGSQLFERRRHVHAQVARGLESIHAEKIDEQAALLAYHWEEAGEALEAARWHRRAADGVSPTDPSLALSHWQRAISLLENLDREGEVAQLETQARISTLVLSVAGNLTPDAAERVFTRGIELTERLQDLRGSILIRAAYAGTRTAMGRGAGWGTFLEETVRMAERSHDLEVQLGTLHALAFALQATGRIPEALRLAERLEPLATSHPDLGIELSGVRPLCSATGWRANLLAFMGRLEEARAARRLAISLARRYEDTKAVIWMSLVGADLADITGDEIDLAEASLAVELSDKIGSVYWQGASLAALGKAQLTARNLSSAQSHLERACELLRSMEHWHESWGLVGLAQLWLQLDDRARARAIAEDAVAIAAQRAARLNEPKAQLMLARVLRHDASTESWEAAARAIAGGLSVAHDIGYLALVPQLLVERAEVSRLRGEDAACEEDLREAHRLFTEMGATGHAERLAKELKGAEVPKCKPVAQKPEAKGKTKAAKPSRRAKPKPVHRTVRRKSKK